MKKTGKYFGIICMVFISALLVTFGIGRINTNSASALADGIYVGGGANYVMSGGKITNRNNAVYITGNSTFTMADGTISGNNCGVYLDKGTFNYIGGTISDEIYLASGMFITLKAQPSATFNIRVASTSVGTRVARLDGISSVTLSRLSVSNLPVENELAIENGYVVIKGKTFTVTIVSNNSNYGTVSASKITNVPYGSSISTSSKTLTINGTSVTATPASSWSSTTTNYSYSFTGWSYSGTKVTSDMTITANFSESTSTRYYTVSFSVNDSSYGSVSPSSISVPYGSSISASGSTITIGGQSVTATPASSWSSTSTEYSYSFSSWSKTSGTITSSTTITATFTRSTSTRKYKVTFNAGTKGDKNGGADSTNYDYEYYGTTISLTSSKVTVSGGWWIQVAGKTTDDYIYTFSGWSTSSSGSTISSYKVTGDTTFYAQYTATPNKITVYFEPNNSNYGSVSRSSIEVSYGASYSTSGSILTINGTTIHANANSGYEFNHWSCLSSGTVTSSMTITAYFDKKPESLVVAVEEYKILTPYDLAIIMAFNDVFIDGVNPDEYDGNNYKFVEVYESACGILEYYTTNNIDPFEYLAYNWGPDNNVDFVRTTFTNVSDFNNVVAADLYFSNNCYYNDGDFVTSLYEQFGLMSTLCDNRLQDIGDYSIGDGWVIKGNHIWDCVILSRFPQYYSTEEIMAQMSGAGFIYYLTHDGGEVTTNDYQQRINFYFNLFTEHHYNCQRVGLYEDEENVGDLFNAISQLIYDGYDVIVLPEEIFEFISFESLCDLLEDVFAETFGVGPYLHEMATIEGLYNCILVNVEEIASKYSISIWEVIEFSTYLSEIYDDRANRIWGKVNEDGRPYWQ